MAIGLEAFKIFKKHFKISVYHTRHNETGFEMCIEDKYGNYVYEQITEQEHVILKEVLL